MISIIFPTYNEEASVVELHGRLVKVMESYGQEYEIIAIDDGSTDATLLLLNKLFPLRVISLAYNSGQSAALDAGIREARGDWVVIIDADLQNDPTDIPRLLNKMLEGYGAVVGWRRKRYDKLSRRIFSRFANFIVRKISHLSIHDYGCALRVFRKSDLEDVRLYGAMHIYIPIILANRGVKIAEVSVNHNYRKFGVSKYPIWQMISNLSDLLTIKFFYNHSRRPLVFFGKWALISVFISALVCLWAIIIKVKGILGLSQTPLPVLAAVFFILGIFLFMLGFVAELLIRIYYETRGHSFYRVCSVTENKKDNF